MNKSVLMGAAAGLTLAASGAFAGPDTVLWEQDAGSDFDFVNSQDWGSEFAQYSDAAADDFVVPSGQTWHVAEVDVTGVYFNGSGSGASQTITFYTDKKGKPGRVYRGPFTLKCTDPNFGSPQCVLPKPVRLRSGTWWVSLVTDLDFAAGGEWGWATATVVQGNEARWENPGGTGKCTSFKPLHRCFGGSPADLAFKLYGKAVGSD